MSGLEITLLYFSGWRQGLGQSPAKILVLKSPVHQLQLVEEAERMHQERDRGRAKELQGTQGTPELCLPLFHTHRGWAQYSAPAPLLSQAFPTALQLPWWDLMEASSLSKSTESRKRPKGHLFSPVARNHFFKATESWSSCCPPPWLFICPWWWFPLP